MTKLHVLPFRRCIFLNENHWISIKITLKFVPQVWINNIPALVQIMAWPYPGNKALSEPMILIILTHTLSLNELRWVVEGYPTDLSDFICMCRVLSDVEVVIVTFHQMFCGIMKKKKCTKVVIAELYMSSWIRSVVLNTMQVMILGVLTSPYKLFPWKVPIYSWKWVLMKSSLFQFFKIVQEKSYRQVSNIRRTSVGN